MATYKELTALLYPLGTHHQRTVIQATAELNNKVEDKYKVRVFKFLKSCTPQLNLRLFGVGIHDQGNEYSVVLYRGVIFLFDLNRLQIFVDGRKNILNE